MPHNGLLQYICNIGTDARLLFTKSPSSEFQYLFCVLYTIEFIQFHIIVITIWNEWFGWIHTIWVWYGKTSLLLFCDFIFPHPSPIIWILYSFHLCCIEFYLFLQSNDLLPPLHVESCWYIIRTTCYQKLPLVTCRVNSWRGFFSTRGCLFLLLTRNRLPIFTNSWCLVTVYFSLTYFNLF